MKRNMQGFTLIELMIVVAIIAILAAIAISQYQDYVIRTQVSEGASLAGGMKTAITEYHNNHGKFATGTTANASYGLATPASITGKYVQSATANGGKIDVLYGKEAHDQIKAKTLIYSPISHAGSMEWKCSSTGIAAKHLPTVCR